MVVDERKAKHLVDLEVERLREELKSIRLEKDAVQNGGPLDITHLSTSSSKRDSSAPSLQVLSSSLISNVSVVSSSASGASSPSLESSSSVNAFDSSLRPSLAQTDSSSSSATLRKWYNSFSRAPEQPSSSASRFASNENGQSSSSVVVLGIDNGIGSRSTSLDMMRASDHVKRLPERGGDVGLYPSDVTVRDAGVNYAVFTVLPEPLALDYNTPVDSPHPSPGHPSIPHSLRSTHALANPAAATSLPQIVSERPSALPSFATKRPTFTSSHDFPPEAAYASYEPLTSRISQHQSSDISSSSPPSSNSMAIADSDDTSDVLNIKRRIIVERRGGTNTSTVGGEGAKLNLNQQRGIHSHDILEVPESTPAHATDSLSGSSYARSSSTAREVRTKGPNAARWKEQTNPVFPLRPTFGSSSSTSTIAIDAYGGSSSPVLRISKGARGETDGGTVARSSSNRIAIVSSASDTTITRSATTAGSATTSTATRALSSTNPTTTTVFPSRLGRSASPRVLAASEPIPFPTLIAHVPSPSSYKNSSRLKLSDSRASSALGSADLDALMRSCENLFGDEEIDAPDGDRRMDGDRDK